MSLDHLRIENQLPLARLNEFTYFKWLYSYLVLPFNMQAQTQSNWCWAATSTSVSRYYSIFSPWTAKAPSDWPAEPRSRTVMWPGCSLSMP